MILCLFTMIFLCIWTSPAQAVDNNINLVIDAKLIEENIPVIRYENSMLVSIEDLLNLLNISYKYIPINDKKILIDIPNTSLEFYPGSCIAYINKQKVSLITPALFEDNSLFLSINLLDDLIKDFYIKYDIPSQTIFIKNEKDFKQIKFFFNKVENISKKSNIINIDIINEIKGSDESTYSIGSNIRIDKISNKIFQKNMLENNWAESNIKLSSTFSQDFNDSFFNGISVDRINSNTDTVIFYGYYPLDSNKICQCTIFVNPDTLQIEKQTNNFEYNKNTVKQTIFYTYN